MASLDEVISSARSNISAVDEARGAVESTKSKIGEVQSQFAGLGADAKVSETAQLQQTAEQAQTMFEPVKQKLEELVSQAQAMKTLNAASGGGPTYTVDRSTGTVDVGHIDTKNIVGDPVTAPEPDPSDHRKELQGNDDSERTRSQRFGRRFVSQASDLHSTGKDLGNSMFKGIAKRDPLREGQATATVQVDKGQPVITAADHTPAVPDVVAAAVVFTAFTVEGVSRLIGRTKKR